MKPSYKLVSLAGALMAGGMLLSSAANAQVVCPAQQTLVNFLQNPCRDQDKLYTGDAALTTIPSDQIVITFDVVQGTDVHALTYNRTASIPQGVYILAFSIQIVDDPATVEDETTFLNFDEVSLGSNGPRV
jgi:hypothetical protein